MIIQLLYNIFAMRCMEHSLQGNSTRFAGGDMHGDALLRRACQVFAGIGNSIGIIRNGLNSIVYIQCTAVIGNIGIVRHADVYITKGLIIGLVMRKGRWRIVLYKILPGTFQRYAIAGIAAFRIYYQGFAGFYTGKTAFIEKVNYLYGYYVPAFFKQCSENGIFSFGADALAVANGF